MYMLLIASPVINICSTVAWCRPYPRWYFTIFYFQCFPLAGLRLRFFWYVFPQDRQLLGCFFGRWFLIIPCSFSFCSDLAARSGCSFSLQVCSLLATHLPLRQVFFWPAIFDAQVSGFWYPSPAPPRLFLTGYFDAQVSAFRYPSPAPPRLLLTGYLDAQVSGFRCPSPVPPCGTPAVFTAPRFLPLCGFYRSAVFTALRFLPLRGFYRSAFAGFLGALLFRRPHACCPPVFTHFRAARSLCRLAVRLRFLPLRGFYRSAVFTVQCFFTAPRFLPLHFRRFFGGSALPPPSCLLPPSLHPLPGGSLFVPPCGTPAIFTAPLSPVFLGGSALPPPSCLLPPSLRPLPGAPVSLLCLSYTLGDRRSSRLFECWDTGTACTSTSLWNLTAHGNKAFSPQTDGSAVCRYAYWSMKWLYLQMARSQSVVWFPPRSPHTRSPGPRDSFIFNWAALLTSSTL